MYKIKKLVWRKPKDNAKERAYLGENVIFADFDKRGVYRIDINDHPRFGRHIHFPHNARMPDYDKHLTLDEAKEVCQEHFEKEIEKYLDKIA